MTVATDPSGAVRCCGSAHPPPGADLDGVEPFVHPGRINPMEPTGRLGGACDAWAQEEAHVA